MFAAGFVLLHRTELRSHTETRATRVKHLTYNGMQLDLPNEETDALARLVRNAIDGDRYPLSPRVQLWKGILAKIRPEPGREPLPPPNVYAPPRAKARQPR
jgi:hypothetical protein